MLKSVQGGGRRETNTGLWAFGCFVCKALSVFSVFSFSEASRPILRAEDSILGAFQMLSPWMRTPDLSLSRRNVSLLHLQTTKSRKTPSLVPTRAESLWAQVMLPLGPQGLPKHHTVMQETFWQLPLHPSLLNNEIWPRHFIICFFSKINDSNVTEEKTNHRIITFRRIFKLMDSNSLTSAFFSRPGHIGKLHGKLHVKKWVNDLDWMVKLQEQLFWGKALCISLIWNFLT